MNNIIGLQHIGMPENDSEKTIAFYQNLGFEIAYETMNDKERVVFLKKGNFVIETYQNGDAAMCRGSIDHIALDVIDIEKAWKDIVGNLNLPSLEGKISFLPFWKNGVRFFTILGPNKEKIEFSQML